MIGALLGLLLLLALVILAVGAGGALARRIAFASTLERVVFTAPLGMGALGYAVLALGLVGQAKALPLWLSATVLGGGGLAWSLRAWRGDARPVRASLGTLGLVCGAALGLAALLTLIAAFAPPAGQEWDSLSYHLAAPKTYLRAGRIYYLPFDHHSNFPFTLNMLFMLMLSAGSIAGAKLVHWLCGALLVASVVTFARRFLGDGGARIGLIAATILATTPIVLWEASVAYVDLATALFAWLSLYALLCAVEGDTGPKERIAWIVVSAALMGFALGTKMTCLAFWGMLLIGVLGWNRIVRGAWSKETLTHAALWGGLSLAIGAVWYVKTYLYTGNPVYPFFYGLFGGKYWSAANAEQYRAAQAAFGLGKDPVNLLLGPWNVTNEASLLSPVRRMVYTEYVLFGLSPVYVAVLVALPFWVKSMARPLVVALLYGLGVFVFWFYLMQQTRYLVPALPAFALVVAAALEQGSKVVRAAGAALIAASALWGLYLASVQLAEPAVPYLSGAQSLEQYERKSLGPLADAEFWINANTAVDAKVAIFEDTRGFWLDREYAWVEPNHAAGLFGWETFADADAFTTEFKARGYTILLHNSANSPKDPDALNTRWRQLFEEAVTNGKVELIQSFGPVNVFRIR